MDKLYNTKEAAAYIHTTPANLRFMNMRRVIPYYNPSGRKCLYKESDLEAYMTSIRVASSAELNSKAILY